MKCFNYGGSIIQTGRGLLYTRDLFQSDTTDKAKLVNCAEGTEMHMEDRGCRISCANRCKARRNLPSLSTPESRGFIVAELPLLHYRFFSNRKHQRPIHPSLMGFQRVCETNSSMQQNSHQITRHPDHLVREGRLQVMETVLKDYIQQRCGV